MENALAVANFFVKKSLETGKELTPMKLIKLVYIAHGWHLALKNEELLPEAVEAWQYGPVVPSVYLKFKGFADNQVTSFAEVSNISDINIPKVENPETVSFLQQIWDEYSNYNGLELSTLTHLLGTPWYITYNKPENRNEKNVIIPNNLIKEHYKEKLNVNRRALHPQL